MKVYIVLEKSVYNLDNYEKIRITDSLDKAKEILNEWFKKALEDYSFKEENSKLQIDKNDTDYEIWDTINGYYEYSVNCRIIEKELE